MSACADGTLEFSFSLAPVTLQSPGMLEMRSKNRALASRALKVFFDSLILFLCGKSQFKLNKRELRARLDAHTHTRPPMAKPQQQ